MFRYYIFNIRIVVVILVILVTACKEEEHFSGDPYFNIEDNPTGISADFEGDSKSYVVRSNRPWKIVAREENDWVDVFPAEGERDGIFTLTVKNNPTFETRSVDYAFMVDGEEQPVYFLVEQAASIPYITLKDQENVSIQSSGGEIVINVLSNVNWSYTIENNTWLSEVHVSESEIRLLASKNTGLERSELLTISSEQYSDLDQQILISQQPGNILLVEDFNWLKYGSVVPYEYSDAVRYDNWTQEEREKGWTVTPNEYSKNEPLCYACNGYVKLGKTKYGGDLISPKLNIDGTVNLKVTFKSAVYISSGGNVDDRVLNVSVLGAGESDISQFTIDNVPNSKAEDDAGVLNDIWAEDRAYTFTVTGAKSDTQIKFLGGDYDLQGVGQGKNRIFLDDIKIEIIE